MNISPEAWQAISAIGVAATAALSGVLIAMVNRNNKATLDISGKVDDTAAKVDDAASVAEEARDNTVPVSNGYTKKTVGLLELIRDDVKALREEAAADRRVMVDHISDHARAGFHVPAPRDGSLAGG